MHRKIFLSALAMVFAAATDVQALQANHRKDVVVTVLLDAHTEKVTFTGDPTTGLLGTLHAQTDGPQVNPVPGIGMVVKHNKLGSAGKAVMFGETVTNGDGSQGGYSYVFDYPFVTGGAWTAYATKDGVTVGVADSGTYTVSN